MAAAESNQNTNSTISSQKTSDDSQSTTTITSDRAVVDAGRPVPMGVPNPLAEMSTTEFKQEIAEFLGKWQVLTSTTVTTASSGILATIDLPDALLTTPIWAEKTRGYQGMSGTLLLKVLVNANQFQQGRLLLVFEPQGQVTGMLPTRRYNLTTLTQLPRVEMDVSRTSEATMEIPYIAPVPFYNLLTGSGPWGRATLYVYSPLQVGTGSNTFNVTVLGAMDPKSVKLYNPTYVPVAPSVLNLRPQMKKVAIKTRGSYAQHEGVAMGLRPVSGVLEGAAQVATALGQVPLLKDVAQPVGWTLKWLAKQASSFGWARPTDQRLARRVIPGTSMFMSQVDAPDNSLPTAATLSNELQLLPGLGGTDLDELALDYVVSREAWFHTLNWPASSSAGDLLYQKPLGPREFLGITSVTGGSVVTMSPLTVVAQFFNHYHGSIGVRFKLVKTGFHQGRLVVSFWPGQATVTAPTLDDTAYVHRRIVDISITDEFVVLFPYTHNVPYLDTLVPYGCFTIHVLNELVGPDTVSNNINVLMEAFGCPDFEFQLPISGSPEAIVWNGQAPVEEPRDLVLRPQSSTMDPQVVDGPIGGARIASQGLTYAPYTNGERLKSLKQLLSQFEQVGNTVADQFYYRPWSTFSGTSTTIPPAFATFSRMRHNIIIQMYAYQRGSMRSKWIGATYAPGTDTPSVVIGACAVANDAASGTNVLGVLGVGSVEKVTPGDSAQFALPYYSHTYASLVRPVDGTTAVPLDEYTPIPALSINLGGSYSPNNQGTLYTACGDDYQASYFLGVPPIFVPSPSSSVQIAPPLSAPMGGKIGNEPVRAAPFSGSVRPMVSTSTPAEKTGLFSGVAK